MIYNKICALAKKKGISIYRLEKEAKLSKGSICKWEKSIPAVDSLQKVAKLLDVTVDSLLEESQSPQ